MSTAPPAPLPPQACSSCFSVMTYNLWKTDGFPTSWSSRRGVLLRQLRQLDPDVLLVQELCPEIAACVLEALPGHCCVTRDFEKSTDVGEQKKDLFEGWQQEGNIFYRSSLFRAVEWGHEHIEQEESLRRLFWLRLQPLQFSHLDSADPGDNQCNVKRNTCLFSTAHFTWQGHPREYESDINLRKVQARNTAKALNLLQQPQDIACFFGGDLNENFWPKRILEDAGFSDCFSALGLPCRPTHPMRPTLAHEDNNADSVLDWLFARGAVGLCRSECDTETTETDVIIDKQNKTFNKDMITVRPLVATVVRDSVGLSSVNPDEKQILSIQPSDHAPVLAVYRCCAH